MPKPTVIQVDNGVYKAALSEGNDIVWALTNPTFPTVEQAFDNAEAEWRHWTSEKANASPCDEKEEEVRFGALKLHGSIYAPFVMKGGVMRWCGGTLASADRAFNVAEEAWKLLSASKPERDLLLDACRDLVSKIVNSGNIDNVKFSKEYAKALALLDIIKANSPK